MDIRLNNLHKWLSHDCHLSSYTLEPMVGDASFRRYFRVTCKDHSWVAMDAPPDKENCLAFVAISQALRKMDLVAPDIYHKNIAYGFLLITDFGDKQLLNVLDADNVQKFYGEALDTLATLHTCKEVEGWLVPTFTTTFMQQELELFKCWFLQNYLRLNLSSTTENMLAKFFDFILTVVATQPMVFMHRDYHSANLMVLPNNKIGVLDFQDAFRGPLTYDLVSLLRDCYIDWSPALVIELALSYKQRIQLKESDEVFLRWFDTMGLQRHMKALLTFSRKYIRDANSHYLKHIPRTLRYLSHNSKNNKECYDFHDFLHAVILPAYEKVSALCEE